MSTPIEQIETAAAWLRERLDLEGTDLALVLGSGLSAFGDRLEDVRSVGFSEIPGFRTSTVQGHANRLLTGCIGGRKLLVMQGRIHHYEGNSMAEVTFPVRVLARLGIRTLILTNAAGGLTGEPGQLMLIRDHLDLFCPNPLLGENLEELGPRFPDLSAVYPAAYRERARRAAGEAGIAVTEGVYCYLTGPSYETPFDIQVLKALGVNAVGMSTVPEAIVAAHMGIGCLGLSCITNLAAGIGTEPLSHEEVMETTARVSGEFIRLLEGIVKEI